jgi:hypothetical protein
MLGAIPLIPHYAFMAWCLVKHRDKFTFTFLKLNSQFLTRYNKVLSVFTFGNLQSRQMQYSLVSNESIGN